MVKNGYRLPFKTTPESFYAPNNKSSLRNKEFVTSSISQLLKDGCIKEVDEMPFCCNPLTVAEGKKLRLVLDLRHVNDKLDVTKFKYENLKTVAEIFEENYEFCTFDLKHGYHHVPIHKDDQKYLGFSWQFPDGRIRYFIFLVLPFGLASACYAFTKLLRPLVKKWRASGIRNVIYLDDGIFGSSCRNTTLQQSKIIQVDLKAAGLTINYKKSNFIPSTRGEWLGFEIDTSKMIFKVPEAKIEKLLNLLQNTLKSNYVTAKNISKIAGHIISMSIAIGKVSRIFTRQMYKFIDARTSWYKYEYLSEDVKTELKFWLEGLRESNGFRMKENLLTSKIVFSDASADGYGGYLVHRLDKIVARGKFSNLEINTSSTYRELLAVKFVLQSIRRFLLNERVQWNTDNQNVVRIVNNGSSKEHLQALSVEIFQLCMSSNIEIFPQWIPREENVIADDISKFNDNDSWGIDMKTFEMLENIFGKFTIDQFADDTNYKVKRFNAKAFCPGVENVNAFSTDWSNEFNWLCPPVSIIGYTLKHLKLCKADGVLFVPNWRSSYFWPLLTSDGQNFYPFVKSVITVKPYFTNFSKCTSVFSGYANFDSYALLVRFS